MKHIMYLNSKNTWLIYHQSRTGAANGVLVIKTIICVVQVDQLQKSGESKILQGLSGKTSGVNMNFQ